MPRISSTVSLKQLYSVSFVEGGVVMVTELAGAKMLAPFFGASLYSWASTLSITLLALMTGYYFGGYVTTKEKFAQANKIIWVFFLSGLTVLLMPSFGHFIMQRTISFSFFTGLIISELFFLFTPIFLMGMISPMIIFQITKTAEQSGRSAGNIYAISTCGGILFTLVFGFLIIPHYGITTPVRSLGVLVCLMALLFLYQEKKNARQISLLLVFCLLTAFMTSNAKAKQASVRTDLKVLEDSEGLLGELKVTDQMSHPFGSEPVVVRKLRINNIVQNFVFRDMPSQSLLYYVNFTRQLLKVLAPKHSALLVGLGAGSLYKILTDAHMDVETVEIDQRIYNMGIRYFGMADHAQHYITDGRYHLNVTKKKYDLIIIDAIIGENVPGQLITTESFKRCYDLLNPGGTLIIEHGGLTDFSENSFIPSVYQTLVSSGFDVTAFNPLLQENYGDVLFLATKQKMDLNGLSIAPDVFIKGGPLKEYVLSMNSFNTKSVQVFTDDRTNFDVLLKDHYFKVRRGIRKELAGLAERE